MEGRPLGENEVADVQLLRPGNMPKPHTKKLTAQEFIDVAVVTPNRHRIDVELNSITSATIAAPAVHEDFDCIDISINNTSAINADFVFDASYKSGGKNVGAITLSAGETAHLKFTSHDGELVSEVINLPTLRHLDEAIIALARNRTSLVETNTLATTNIDLPTTTVNDFDTIDLILQNTNTVNTDFVLAAGYVDANGVDVGTINLAPNAINRLSFTSIGGQLVKQGS